MTNEIKTYKGFLKGNPDNKVRLSFYGNSLEGFIMCGEDIYYIKPIRKASKDIEGKNVIVIYKGKDLEKEVVLGNDVLNNSMSEENTLNLKSVDYGDPVRIIRIVAEGDYEYYQNHGSDSNEEIESAINMAEEVFQSSFNIIFRIPYINTYTTISDPFTEEFSLANKDNCGQEVISHFTSSHTDIFYDVAYLFTGKPQVDGLKGFAKEPGNYGVVYGNTSSTSRYFVHELGHNLNATHDDADQCGFPDESVMCISSNNTNVYFSEVNKSRISNNIASRLITYNYFDAEPLSGSTTFTVSNVPSGYTVTWPKSTNLSFVGSSTGNTVTIVAASDNKSGWVEPTLSKGIAINTISFPRDKFWVGKKTARVSQAFDHVENVYAPEPLETNKEYEFRSVLTDPSNDPLDYSWEVEDENGLIYMRPQASTMTFSAPEEGNYDVRLSYNNGCGWATSSSNFYYEGGGLFLMMNPNPSSYTTTISLEATTSAETAILKSASTKSFFDENIEWDIEVYDNAQSLKYNKNKLKGNSLKLNTQNWKEGVYIVRAIYKEQLLTGKLIVKK